MTDGRLLLICPANLAYMPYARRYMALCEELGVLYDVVFWNRLGLAENSNWISYDQGQTDGGSASFFGYLKFSRFVRNIARRERYGGVVIFGIQMSFFLSDVLRRFRGRYILDVRDYHFLAKFFDFGAVVKSSYFVAISSEGFLDWLPVGGDYKVFHNSSGICSNALIDNVVEKIPVVSYIGAFRDLEVNQQFLSEASIRGLIRNEFHGHGPATVKLKGVVESGAFGGVRITGVYSPEQEEGFYRSANMINMIIPRYGVNNKSLLPNRIFGAAAHQRPILALGGTFCAEYAARFNLGVILNEIEGADLKVVEYFRRYKHALLVKNANDLLGEVARENLIFKHRFNDFLEICVD